LESTRLELAAVGFRVQGESTPLEASGGSLYFVTVVAFAMKILTSYVLSMFVKILGFVLPVFVALYLVVEFVERLDDFVEHQATIHTILLYFLLRIPIVAVQIGSLGVLLSVALTLALLQRSREIIAFLAAGASPWRLATPLLLGSFIMVVASLGAEEYILPGAHFALRNLQEGQGRSPLQGVLVQPGEIWFRIPGAAFVHIELVDPTAERIHGITIYRKNGRGELLEQVQAREALWMAGQWTLFDGTISRFHGNLPAHVEPFTRLDMPMGIEPEALRSMFRSPSHMSLSELSSYMRKLRHRGIDMAAYARDFQQKLTTPLMSVVMTVVGVAAIWGARDARNLSLGFASTLCGAAIYWLLTMVGTALSGNQQIPLLVGVWLPHLAVLTLSTSIFWHKARA
jgi:lipopolysaccharide export system permease protein